MKAAAAELYTSDVSINCVAAADVRVMSEVPSNVTPLIVTALASLEADSAMPPTANAPMSAGVMLTVTAALPS